MKSIAHSMMDTAGVVMAEFWQAGPMEVWYMKEDCFRDGSVLGYRVVESDKARATVLQTYRNTHVALGTVGAGMVVEALTTRGAAYDGHMTFPYLEDVFVRMQGENWSPQGEARNMIAASGAGHTSMSVGDIVAVNHGVQGSDDVVRSLFMVAPVGFVYIGRERQTETVTEKE